MDTHAKKWIGMIAGFIGLMALFNGILLSAALGDNGFAPEPDAYKKALAWDAHQAAIGRSRALGWKTSVQVTPAQDGKAQLTLSVRDGQDQPVNLSNAEVVWSRPADARLHHTLTLRGVGPGQYEVSVPVPVKGLWEAQLSLSRGQEVYQDQPRLEVR